MPKLLPVEQQPKPKKPVAKKEQGIIGWVKQKAQQLDSALNAAPPIPSTRTLKGTVSPVRGKKK
ncbi:MAG: hypothetical protein KGJ87_08860 [Planctomycetota bacterium]|nr:hypothetical protein [Planctomycetota bacterium]MDE2217251.1 hypothetical protein [Planctomycetota bacterium]